MMRFDRFTERAQEAAQRAAEIIQRYGHNQIDTEHILLDLIEQPQGVISQILEMLNIDAEPLMDRLDYILKTSPKDVFHAHDLQIVLHHLAAFFIELAQVHAGPETVLETQHTLLRRRQYQPECYGKCGQQCANRFLHLINRQSDRQFHRYQQRQ